MAEWGLSNNELSHYGVLGMKWGVRKEKARLSGVSAREYTRQLKAENRKARLLGKQATIADRLSDYTDKKSSKIINKNYKKKSKDAQLATKAAIITQNRARQLRKEADYDIKEHYAYLVKKYGGTNVSSIRRDAKGRVDEKVNIKQNYMRSFVYNALLVDHETKGVFPKSKDRMVKDAYEKLSSKTMSDLRKELGKSK